MLHIEPLAPEQALYLLVSGAEHGMHCVLFLCWRMGSVTPHTPAAGQCLVT